LNCVGSVYLHTFALLWLLPFQCQTFLFCFFGPVYPALEVYATFSLSSWPVFAGAASKTDKVARCGQIAWAAGENWATKVIRNSTEAE